MPEVWHAVAGGNPVTQDELKEVARELLAAANGISVWLFYGEMGSGKTTLIKAIASEKGVEEGMSSPTFSLVNEYNTTKREKIFHFDLYRLSGEKEVYDIGAEEYFDSNNLCLVEWPEKLGSLIPGRHLKIRLTPSGRHHRKIEYQLV